MQVDFMLIGAQKCATSSLAHQLSQHDQICFCSKKEPHFFSRNRQWKDGIEAYHQLFAPQPGQLCGEGSTSYTFFPEFIHVANNLHEYNPNLRLIYSIRNPVDRIISHYQHRVIAGRMHEPFEKAVFKDPSYINRSRYGVQLRYYLEVFPRNNILVLLFDEFITNPALTWERISTFLEIDPLNPDTIDTQAKLVTKDTRRLKTFYGSTLLRRVIHHLPASIRNQASSVLYHKSESPPNVSSDLRHALWLLLEDDISFVEELLGFRLEMWRQAN